MVSIWLVVLAFLAGGIAGMLVFALTALAGREDERATDAEEAMKRRGLGKVERGPERKDPDRWSATFS